MTLPKLHVAVLMGGWSNERPVSLMSGEGVASALEARGHRVTRIDMGRDVALRLHEAKPDVVFNALHGVPGEDGSVQGMLDLMGLAYTHSGLATSVIAIDKQLTKQALVPHGIPMPGGRIVRREELYERDPLPHWSQGRVSLLGDACHPMMPFMAQGAGMAIEDAVVLARNLDAVQDAEGVAQALQNYEAMRKQRTSQIQIGSRGNNWLRAGGNADWVYGYDAWQVALTAEPVACST